MSNIGMMDSAFFVGRKELIDWINDTLEVNLQKVEQTASGAIACQLFDIMHPGQVSMSKVNWGANKDFEFVANYKVLQTAFTKLHVDRHIDVDRLIKGKYQDNLEFMQWFKRFFELATPDKSGYDLAGSRLRGKGGAEYNSTFGRGSGAAISASENAPPVRSASGATSKAPARSSAAAPSSRRTTAAPVDEPVKPTAIAAAAAVKTAAPRASAAIAPSTSVSKDNQAREIVELKESNEKLSQSIDDMKQEMDGLEKERNFYFDKLRDIEMMLQDLEDSGNGTELTASIFKILYATAEGFDRVAEEKEAEKKRLNGDMVVAEAEDEETF